MKQDNELTNLLIEYGIKISALIKRTTNQAALEYLFSLFTLPERTRLNRKIQLEAIRRAEKTFSAEALERLKDSMSEFSGQLATDIDDYARDLCRKVLYRIPSLNRWLMSEIEILLTQKLSKGNQREKKTKPPAFKTRLNEIKRVFNLNENETSVLQFLYLKETVEGLETVFRNPSLKMDELNKSVRNYCHFFNMSPHDLKDMLKKDSALVGSGLISRDQRTSTIEIESHVTSFLAGISTLDLTATYFEKANRTADLSVDDFALPRENTAVIQSLLAATPSVLGCNILLHGTPGTGKTEFSKSLAKDVDAELYFVKQTDDDGDERLSYRKTALVAAQNLLRERKCILVVDEADPIINTTSGIFMCDMKDKNDEKSWINHYIENSKINIIWISNRIQGIDDSTKRRFSYAQEFREPEIKQRLKAWQIQTRQNRITFLNEKTLEKLASQYHVSPGTIALALRDIEATQPKASNTLKLASLRNILSQKQAFCAGNKTSMSRVSSNYSLEGLNTDISLDTVRTTISRFYDKLNHENSDLEIPNLNLLLLGPPGSGKTEFVKHLSERIEKELVIKRTSDLLSKYVGEAEQNIARAFRDAEAKNALLFLDEADSLFINRAGASHSWEVSQTNELLCQMEQFKGVLVCATNFDKHLDKAVLRRFGYKIKFDYLKPEANLIFFNKFLASLIKQPLTEVETQQLCSIQRLAPGDFKVVYQKHYLNGHADSQELIADLQAEVAMKQSGEMRSIQGLRG